jgi:hypothetical protein
MLVNRKFGLVELRRNLSNKRRLNGVSNNWVVNLSRNFYFRVENRKVRLCLGSIHAELKILRTKATLGAFLRRIRLFG